MRRGGNWLERIIGKPGGELADKGPRDPLRRTMLWVAAGLLALVCVLSSYNVGLFLATPLIANQSSGDSDLVGRLGNSDGIPLDNATIYVLDHDLTGITDSQGFFEIEDVPSGMNTVRFYAEGYRTKQYNVIIASKGTTDINEMLDIGKWLTLDPYVEDVRAQNEITESTLTGGLSWIDSTPLVGADLTLSYLMMDQNGTLVKVTNGQNTTTTDSNGEYLFGHTRTGWYELEATTTISPPTTTGVNSYELSVKLYIHGQGVTFSHVINASHWLTPEDNIQRVDNTIRESIDLLTNVTLSVTADLSDPTTDWPMLEPDKATVRPAIYRATVYVGDPSLLLEPEKGPVKITTVTDINGELTMQLIPGLYNLTVSREGTRLADITGLNVSANRDLDVTLEPGTTISGKTGIQIIDAVQMPLLIGYGVVFGLFSLAAGAGAVLCLIRRRYAIALLCAIAGMLTIFPVSLGFCSLGTLLSLLAFMLIFRSRMDFRS